MPPEWGEVKRWLEKAKNDRVAAGRILEPDATAADTAGFHCQQAVEKALKAFLAFSGRPPGRVHDLGRILDWCEQIDSTFANLRDRVEPLTPFAIAFRYPGPPDPPVEEVRAALQVVDEVLEFVIARLPPETHP